MGTDAEQLVLQAIHDWRDSLINLTASNRLLNFKPRKTSAVGAEVRRGCRRCRP